MDPSTITVEAVLQATQPVDEVNVNALLSDEEREIRDRVRQFVDQHVIPVSSEYWDKAEFPFELLPGMGRRKRLPLMPVASGSYCERSLSSGSDDLFSSALMAALKSFQGQRTMFRPAMAESRSNRAKELSLWQIYYQMNRIPLRHGAS